MGVGGSLASSAETATGSARASARTQPSLFRRHPVDSPDRRSVAVFTRRVSFALDVLAAAQAMGRRGRVVEGVAHVAGGAGPGATVAVGRGLSRRQLRSREKGRSAVGKTKRGKGTKWMVLVDGEGLPLGVRLESASPSEVTLAETTLAQVRVPRPKGRPRQKPKRVIADRGYDSDPLHQRLRRRGIELIVPYRKNNQHRRYEDGRKLRRYKRRWIVERTNACWDNSVGCWFVMSIYSAPIAPSSSSCR